MRVAIAIALLCLPVQAKAEWAIHEQVIRSSVEHSVDADLLLAIIHVESTFRTHAISSSGARGLMQLKPSTAEWVMRKWGVPYLGPDSLHDPRVNIPLGARYLAYLLDRFENPDHAIIAYNIGPNALARKLSRGDIIPRKYLIKVKKALK